MPYATLSDFTAAGSIANLSAADINGFFLPLGQSRVDAALGRKYTVPLSSNIPLVVQLNVLYARHAFFAARTRAEDAKELGKLIDSIISDVVSGNVPLLDSSGVTIDPSNAGAVPWSNTMGHPPTFNTLPEERQRVSRELLNETIDGLD